MQLHPPALWGRAMAADSSRPFRSIMDSTPPIGANSSYEFFFLGGRGDTSNVRKSTELSLVDCVAFLRAYLSYVLQETISEETMAATHRRMLQIENLVENSLSNGCRKCNGSSMEACDHYKSPTMAA